MCRGGLVEREGVKRIQASLSVLSFFALGSTRYSLRAFQNVLAGFPADVFYSLLFVCSFPLSSRRFCFLALSYRSRFSLLAFSCYCNASGGSCHACARPVSFHCSLSLFLTSRQFQCLVSFPFFSSVCFLTSACEVRLGRQRGWQGSHGKRAQRQQQ